MEQTKPSRTGRSAPRRFRYAVVLGMIAALASCAPRIVTEVTAPVPEATQQTLFFATQRTEDQLGRIFGEARSQELWFGKLDVSIPPDHEPGQIEWHSKTPNPEREFAITDVTRSDDLGAFVREAQDHQNHHPKELLVFVHGFNTTAVQASFRLAQIQQDLGLKDPGVLFTWPSAARSTGYVYDRDSVLYARDDLVEVLTALTARNHRLFVVGHSMGAQLTMEALRQARLTGNQTLFDGLAGVVLMSPDIDLDVFHRQAEAIGSLPQPFFIFGAEQDRALGISSILTGRPRVGRTMDTAQLERDDVTILDFTDYAEGQRFDHLVPVTSPTALAVLRSFVDRDLAGAQDYQGFLNTAANRPGGH